MTEASWHFILLPSYFFLSDRRVPPGECGLASSDGDPGTNGVISKLAAELEIKTIRAVLQGASSVGSPTRIFLINTAPSGRCSRPAPIKPFQRLDSHSPRFLSL